MMDKIKFREVISQVSTAGFRFPLPKPNKSVASHLCSLLPRLVCPALFSSFFRVSFQAVSSSPPELARLICFFFLLSVVAFEKHGDFEMARRSKNSITVSYN